MLDPTPTQFATIGLIVTSFLGIIVTSMIVKSEGWNGPVISMILVMIFNVVTYVRLCVFIKRFSRIKRQEGSLSIESVPEIDKK